jgi:hypothetical protein
LVGDLSAKTFYPREEKAANSEYEAVPRQFLEEGNHRLEVRRE